MDVPRLCIFQQPDTNFYYIAYTSNIQNRLANLQNLTKIPVLQVRHQCEISTAQDAATARARCRVAKEVIKLHLTRPDGRRMVAVGQTLWYEISENEITELIGFIDAHCELWAAQDNDDQEDQDLAEFAARLEAVTLNSN
ncbi:hypothetical protein BsWGS_25259 [Bradybaena similaris]